MRIDPWLQPPLTVESTLHLAWGFSLGLSHEENQVKLGAYFQECFRKVRDTNASDPVALKYLDNLEAMLSRFVRTLGFERDVYATFLDTQKETKQAIIENTKNIADLQSLASEGTIVRIASFLGFGSIAGLLANTNPFSQIQVNVVKSLETVADNLERNATILTDRSGAAAILLDASGEIRSIASGIPQQDPFINPIIFLAAGFVGMVAFSFFLKYKWRDWRIKRANEDAARRQADYWKKQMRPRFFESLNHFCEDVVILVREFYPNYAEPRIADPGERKKIIDDILPSESVYDLPPATKEQRLFL